MYTCIPKNCDIRGFIESGLFRIERIAESIPKKIKKSKKSPADDRGGGGESGMDDVDREVEIRLIQIFLTTLGLLVFLIIGFSFSLKEFTKDNFFRMILGKKR